MRKTRVMQLVLSLSPGGTERLVIEIVRGVSGRVDSVVCCLDTPGEWAAELTSTGIPVVSLSRAPGFQPRLSLQLARLLKEHSIDVVHCHHYSPYVYGRLASLLTPGVQLVFTEHGRLSDAAPSPKRRLVNPLLSRLGGRLCAVSGDLRQHMMREGFPARCISVVYNGIEPGRRPSAAQRHDARRALGVADEALVIGAAGRLDPVKNLALLLQVQALVRERRADAHTVIVGDGPERAALETRARELGLDGSVTFAGYRSDVRALMAAFDVFVNSSHYEGVSLTILEAMAAALPVVATPVGGNPEVVIDRETGLLVPGQPRAMADAILRLGSGPHLRRVLGDAGRWRVKKHFSMQRMIAEYADLYLGRRAAVAAAPISVPAAADAISVSDATRSIV
ncbi:MAG TPA: glycosyltransferase [Vicinamibacterales bacterium]|nr:glycosyltransferase [Vicinamibacterales bacterium]